MMIPDTVPTELREAYANLVRSLRTKDPATLETYRKYTRISNPLFSLIMSALDQAESENAKDSAVE